MGCCYSQAITKDNKAYGRQWWEAFKGHKTITCHIGGVPHYFIRLVDLWTDFDTASNEVCSSEEKKKIRDFFYEIPIGTNFVHFIGNRNRNDKKSILTKPIEYLTPKDQSYSIKKLMELYQHSSCCVLLSDRQFMNLCSLTIKGEQIGKTYCMELF